MHWLVSNRLVIVFIGGERDVDAENDEQCQVWGDFEGCLYGSAQWRSACYFGFQRFVSSFKTKYVGINEII